MARRWRRAAAVLGVSAFGAGLVQCSSGDGGSPTEAAGAPTPGDKSGHADGDAATSSEPGSRAGEAGGVPPNALDPAASGLVVVHAAGNIPAFRLCFGKSGVAGNLLPLPDRELMPQSNVVGVEVGSAVRMKPLADVGLTLASNGGTPHTVYAIPERYLRPPQRPANTPCAALICPGLGGDCLDANQFYTLPALPPATYDFGVHLLVLSGCVAGSGDVATCGADFNASNGNAKVESLQLQAYTHTKPEDFVVQIAQLSTPLAGQKIGIAFGGLGSPTTPINVTSTFGAISPAAPLTLSFPRSDPAVYANQGFKVDVPGLSISESLASIQALSVPDTLPNDFYATRTSFAMLLLGNPADTAPNGGPSTPTTDPGRVLHFIGVPVGTPYAGDAGVDAGPYDGGKSDASDAGGKG
jgi:hypothetical protein